MKNNEDQFRKVVEFTWFYKRFAVFVVVGEGGCRQVCGPHSAKFRDVVKQYLRSHLTYHQFW